MTDSRTTGLVREWHADDGWGVLDSADTPGGCWCHFSAVSTGDHASLDPGTPVEFAFEPADQDGYAYRATDAWPKGLRVERPAPITGPSIGYSSRRTIRRASP